MLAIHKLQKNVGQFKLGPFDLQIDTGNYFVLLGPSGSGKSLLLDLISGFAMPEQGSMLLNGIDLVKVPAYKRKTGYLVQQVLLFPHLNVEANIAYALRSRKMAASQRQEKIQELADSFGIRRLLHRKTNGLSGGEAQRVALARIFASDPEILLLDEPLSGIDVQLKAEMMQLFKTLNKKGLTILHVTHDFEEGIRLADQMGIMHHGKLLQTGSPDEIIQHPANAFVARLTGNRNFFPARLFSKNHTREPFAQVDKLEFRLETKHTSGDGFIFFQENKVELHAQKPSNLSENLFWAEIKNIQKLPYGFEIQLDAGKLIYVWIDEADFRQRPFQSGDQVWMFVEPSNITFIKNQH